VYERWGPKEETGKTPGMLLGEKGISNMATEKRANGNCTEEGGDRYLQEPSQFRQEEMGGF